MRARLIVVLAVVLAGCGDLPTDTAMVASPTAGAPPSEQDKGWLRTIHEGNLAEVQAGRLAEGKGTTKRVKAIGRMLVRDHTQLDVQVAGTATRLGVQLPTSPSRHQQEELERMRSATGSDFDEDFLAAMTKEHTAAIAATKAEISNGTSPAVVSLARGAAPKLQQHLTALRQAHGTALRRSHAE
ncbi:MAG TPA: DUF4142 domain-containing protein [Nonomuraea sp.]|nr:DUF4142 domain-containing protein [Nonomuraea sp.]